MHNAANAKIHALVPCAGVGARAGAGLPKQYAPLLGRPMVVHTLEALLRVSSILQVLVVTSTEDTHFDAAVPAALRTRVRVASVGGATRAATVTRGLHSLLAQGVPREDWVLVHDAARCLIEPPAVQRLIDACLVDAVGGLLAMPLADTLKQRVGERSDATLDRGDKWLAQTPQMFRIGPLLDALESAGDSVTDEASAMERLGLKPLLVRGDPTNIKVTWPEEFALAERWMKSR